jgi:ribosomal protein L32
VTEILKGPIVRWRTGDGPTSFCDKCGTPVLAGFSPVRWDVIMVDAVGHRPHDCDASRQAAAALRAQPVARAVDVPELPAVETTRRAVRTLAPVVASAPVETPEAKPRRRPADRETVAVANSCEACGNLKASVNGEWVCLHCA